MAERAVACPRCGVRMEYWVEMELGSDGTKRIKYYYRCPRCGYRLMDAVITVKRVDGRIILEREEHRVQVATRVGVVRRQKGNRREHG